MPATGRTRHGPSIWDKEIPVVVAAGSAWAMRWAIWPGPRLRGRPMTYTGMPTSALLARCEPTHAAARSSSRWPTYRT